MSGINTVVVLDTETTGLAPEEGAALLEVATLCVVQRGMSDWKFEDPQAWMIRHDGPVPAETRAVHHIAPSQVGPGSDAVDRDGLIHGMVCAEVPGEMVYAAHNAAFDRQFLTELELPWICTYRCALHLWPELAKHSNQYLRYELDLKVPENLLYEDGDVHVADHREGVNGEELVFKLRAGRVPLSPHRAAYDVAVTAALLKVMLADHTPEELVQLSAKPALLRVARFGKHRGEKWADVPRSYLNWMLEKSDMLRDDADLRHTVRHHLGLPTQELLT